MEIMIKQLYGPSTILMVQNNALELCRFSNLLPNHSFTDEWVQRYAGTGSVCIWSE